MKMDVVTAAGWRPPVGISYGQPMEAKRSKKLGVAPAPLTTIGLSTVNCVKLVRSMSTERPPVTTAMRAGRPHGCVETALHGACGSDDAK
jgi:hypothetical protein